MISDEFLPTILFMQVDLIFYHLHGYCPQEVERAKQAIELASSQGKWICLHNCQTSPNLLTQVLSLLEHLPPQDNWRLWLSLHGDCDTLPSPLLRRACKLVLDSPYAIHSNVIYNLMSMGSDILPASSRPEWLPLLHAMFLFHGTLRLRIHTYKYSWKKIYPWTCTHLMVSIK